VVPLTGLLRAPASNGLVIRRLPISAIHSGRRYRYIDSQSKQQLEGTLTRIGGGGRYYFDTGMAHGAAKVLEEVGTGSSSASGGDSFGAAAAAAASSSKDEMDEEKEQSGDGGAASADEMADSDDAPPLAEQLLGVARGFGLADDTVISVLIEMTRQGIDTYRSNGLMQLLLTDPGTIASCMKTADNLVALFRSGPAVGAGAATRGDQASMTTTAQNLCTAIEQNAGGCIARITYGIHGFVVVVAGGKAELLQSFASGDAPETLALHCKNPRRFSVSGVCDVLKQMAGTSKAGRKDGQTTISGDPDYEPETVLEDHANTFPNVNFDWAVYPIPTVPEILERVRGRIEDNLKVVKRHLPK